MGAARLRGRSTRRAAASPAPRRLNLAYLADTSAWIKSRQRSARPWLRERFEELLLDGEIVICDVVKLELLHHEEAPAAFRARREDLNALTSAPINEPVCLRALEVQAEIASHGGARHRGVKLPDYLIAAAAELSGSTVLHYDADYELVAEATGQPHEWLAPRGTL